MRHLGLLLTLSALLLSPAAAATSFADAVDYPACRHPYPCGNEWPSSLHGPFSLKTVLQVRIPAADGVVLNGWVGLPNVPDGVKVPVALHSSLYHSGCSVNPYWGVFCDGGPEDDGWWTDPPADVGIPAYQAALNTWGIAPIDLIKRGIAAAFVDVRGTGNSGGCFDLFGAKEQRDQAVIVEWLARQPWTNGRVAMGGLSHPGTTPLMAAIQSPPSLKTLVVGGIFSDLYLDLATPQGAKTGVSHSFTVGQAASDSLVPPLGSGPRYGLVEHAPVLPERACSETLVHYYKDATDMLTDHRAAAYYNERRFIDRFDRVTASVLMAHGLRDDTGHAFQDSELWRTMPNAPKRVIEGQWGHVFPFDDLGTLDPAWENDTWNDLVLDWLDFWLWGKGSLPEKLGTVAYQDALGHWRESAAWPPLEAHDEVVYLGGRELTTQPGGRSRSFRSAPNPLNSYRGTRYEELPYTPWDALCPTPVTKAAELSGLIYLADPLRQPVTVAGNPFAYLRLVSDLPGGIVTLKLIDIGPNFSCNPLGQPRDVRFLSGGAADLRFHQGGFTGRDFPTGTPTNVRIDLFDLAETIQSGHRLALEVGFGESHIEYMGQPYFSRITVLSEGGNETSHIVLPVVEGTLGGQPPTVTYPPRPFVPN